MIENEVYWHLSIFVIGIVLAYLFYLKEKKRSADLEKASSMLGLSYKRYLPNRGFGPFSGILQNYAPVKAEVLLPETQIAKAGKWKRVTNLLEGERNGRHWQIFDYAYTLAFGKKVHRQTTYVSRLHKSIPAFSVRPEGIFDKIGDAFKKNDIDLPDSPGFSKKYYLQGENKEEVKKLFSPELTSILEKSKEKFVIESDGKKIVLFVPEKLTRPNELLSEFERASRIFNIFDPKRTDF
ncbi:MAG: hypothetical protein JW727_05325 [Candidatus Aenigmarchaeota archaeon]|nr:hypothetical protein [Candidatus Aenigmarchaeota archaeon]